MGTFGKHQITSASMSWSSEGTLIENIIARMLNKSYARKQIFLPQDHGSWIFLVSPLLIGLSAGGRVAFASLWIVITSVTAFLLRQPITMAIKVYSGRRPRADLPAARFWIIAYGLVLLLALTGLILSGAGYILLLAIPGIPVFAWHLWLVSRREERRQVNLEIIATGVLALAAPAMYWVGTGRYDLVGCGF